MTIHSENRIIRHTPEQLFQLVADVQHYPAFLPWCLASRVKTRSEDQLVADIIIGFPMFREHFTSPVQLDKAALQLQVDYAEGPFTYLKNTSQFLTPHDGCLLDLYVDFEFKSRSWQTVIESLFTEAVRRMVGAFEARADVLYTPQISASSRDGNNA